MSSGSLYIDAAHRRQSRLMMLAATALVAVSLGGCSAIGLPVGELAATGQSPALPTKVALLASARTHEGVDPSDWEAVRRVVAQIPANGTAEGLDWSNPDTGSAGTISEVSSATPNRGSLCRGFAATVNDARGIRRYRGQACERTDGRWQLLGVVADDAALS